MVFHDIRSRRSREEVPRRFREYRSLERSPWGTSHLLSNASEGLMFGVLTEMIGVCLQEDRLWIADPKAINHILQKSGYLYAKPSDARERSALLTDRGILWAGGESSITVGPSPLHARLTIPQATCTSVTGGQWPLRLAWSRPKVCSRILWIPLTRHTSFACIWSRMLIRPSLSDGGQVEWHDREQQVRKFSHYRRERVVRKGHPRCVRLTLAAWLTWVVD